MRAAVLFVPDSALDQCFSNILFHHFLFTLDTSLSPHKPGKAKKREYFWRISFKEI